MSLIDLEKVIDHDDIDEHVWFLVCDGCGQEDDCPDNSPTSQLRQAAKHFYGLGWRHESTGIHCPDCTEETTP